MDLRVLRTAKATLRRTFYLDEVGTPAGGAVGVSVTRYDGTVIDAAAATGPDANQAYEYTFPGRDVLDELKVTWTATVGGDAIVLDQDRIQVVGGFYFGIAEGRAVDSALSNTTRYPTAALVEARTYTEDECERITEQAWVPRFCRETLSGLPNGPLFTSNPLIRAVRAVTVNGTVYGPTEVAGLTFSDLGVIYAPGGTHWGSVYTPGSLSVTIEYEHGHDRPTPDILRGAKTRFKSLVLASQSALSDRAERQVAVDQQGGTVVYGSPTADKVGIPETDAAYARAPRPRPGFG
jgi:hypothetical protein